jgi:dTDP-4-amino-4,6-dideoxygalactose transaminase
VNYTGAKPRIIDIDRDSYNMTYAEVRENVSKKTKAIIIPHMFGLPVSDIDKINKIGIPVIEDCAQSLGAKINSKLTGNFGRMSIFSFYATKLICSGEGGMILTNDSKAADRARDLLGYDEKKDYKLRYNYKITDIQSVVGIIQLKKIDMFIKKRKEIAEMYNKAFSGLDLKLPVSVGGRVYFRYIAETEKNINYCMQQFEKKGIVCRMPVFKPLHRYFNMKGFSVAQEAWAKSISIPIYPSLTKSEIDRIVAAAKQIFK